MTNDIAKTSPAALPTRDREATMTQNSAAGGAELRKLRLKAGDIVTVPLSVSPSNGAFRVILRFKRCGSTVQRFVGTLNVDSRIEALKQRWGLIREPKIVESNGWSWVTASP